MKKNFKFVVRCITAAGFFLMQTGCLVPGPCGFGLWYPGVSIGEPRIGSGDGSTLDTAVTIWNWGPLDKVLQLERQLIAPYAVDGSIKEPEIVKKNGKTFHRLCYVDRKTNSPQVQYFEVSRAVKKTK